MSSLQKQNTFVDDFFQLWLSITYNSRIRVVCKVFFIIFCLQNDNSNDRCLSILQVFFLVFTDIAAQWVLRLDFSYV